MLSLLWQASPDTIQLTINDSTLTSRMREQSDGTLLATFAGETHQISAQEEPLGMRLELDGSNILIPTQFDPSELRSDVNGKVRRNESVCVLSLLSSIRGEVDWETSGCMNDFFIVEPPSNSSKALCYSQSP